MSYNKTNAMRLLDASDIPYHVFEYEYDENDLNGMHVAEATGMNPDQVFKTLVARGDKQAIFVFCVPVSCTLNLKKAAKVSGQKKVELIHMKELLPITGYIRGGCSPIGMKKNFPVFIDETAVMYDTIAVSGGLRGLQIVINPENLMSYCDMQADDLIDY